MKTTNRPSKADKLARAAQDAAQVRAHDTDPSVVAYRVERVRTWVDRLIWTGLVMGLLFTMTNVQAFAAQGEEKWTPTWWTAWLLDPMVSLVLLGLLLGEQAAAKHGHKIKGWVRATKWVALIFTYVMNTWDAWDKGDPAKIVLHSVPVVIVFCAAEAVTDLRHLITKAINSAFRAAASEAETKITVNPERFTSEPSRSKISEPPATLTEPLTEKPSSEPIAGLTGIADSEPPATLIGEGSSEPSEPLASEVSEPPVSEASEPAPVSQPTPVSEPPATSAAPESRPKRTVAKPAKKPSGKSRGKIDITAMEDDDLLELLATDFRDEELSANKIRIRYGIGTDKAKVIFERWKTLTAVTDEALVAVGE